VQRGVVKSLLKELAYFVENVNKKHVALVAFLEGTASFNSQATEVVDLVGQSDEGY
jgi:hypothetical protein